MTDMTIALILSLLSVATQPRAFPDERSLLDSRLETLRRILPDGATVEADAALISTFASESRLSVMELKPGAIQEEGSRGIVPIELVAAGRFLDIEGFFRQVALSHRLVDVAHLSLSATTGDVLRVKASLRLPFRVEKAPLPPPPDGWRNTLRGVPRTVADAFLRNQALAVSKSEAIVMWRRSRRNPRLFLSELAAAVRDRPIIIRFATLNDDFRLSGMAVGEATMHSLESRLERGFCRLSDFLVMRQSACHHFEARGTCPVVGVDAELPLPNEDPFLQDDSPCQIDRDPATTVFVKDPNPKRRGNGPLSLRLRDVDVADVFMILHQLTRQGFLIDEEVKGRVNGDLSRVTLEEALAVIQKADFMISPPAPIRRVSLSTGDRSRRTAGKTEKTAERTEKDSGPTVSLLFKRADVRDVLATLAEVDAGYAALGPQGFLGRLSLWSSEISLVKMWPALLEASRLTEKIEDGRRLLERNPGSNEALLPVASSPPPARRLVLEPQEMSVREIEPVALATAGSGWRVYCYGPTGTLKSYRAGDRLADGSVRSVESTDIVLVTDEGPLRIVLPPSRR
ncbi:MAG: type 4a pilus biogenesis protein PilO [Vicinamibacteria bacterium]|nr:type 4a pilus biogenesis protein PilO [Vicinamibacteria bacterium]